MDLKLILLACATLIFSGCMESGLYTTSFMFQINNDTGDIEPINFDQNRTLRVYSLFVDNPNSITIGRINETDGIITLSANQTFFPGINVTLDQGFINKDFSVRGSTPGVQVLTNTNLNTTSPWATTITSAGDYEGNAVGTLKRSPTFEDPYLGMLLNLDGDLEIGTNKDNNGSVMGSNEVNFIMYQEFNITSIENMSTALNVTVENKSYIMGYNATDIYHHKPSTFNDVIYINQSYGIGESPDARTDKLGIFARDDDKLYFITPDGTRRRIVDAGSGSYVFDEITKFNNTEVEFHNTTVTHTDLSGVGNAMLCVDENGTFYRGGLSSC